MASWKGHILFSFAFVGTILFLDWRYFHIFNSSLIDLAWFIPIIIFMSNAPDLDHQSSNVREFTTIALLIAILALFWPKQQPFYALILLVILISLWILPRFDGWGHRQHMHSIVFLLFLSIPLFFIGDWKLYLIGFLAGFSHLLADLHVKIW